MEHVACGLEMDPLEIKRKNFLQQGDALFYAKDPKVQVHLNEKNPMPEVIDKICKSSNWEVRQAAVEQFNKVILSNCIILN